MTNSHKPTRSYAILLVLGLSVLAGCDETGIVGKWEGTYEDKKHTLEFQSNGRLYQSSDVYGHEGMSRWEVTHTRYHGDVKIITVEKNDSSGKKKLYIRFSNTNEIRIRTDFISDLRFSRIVSLAASDSKNHAAAYMLVVLAICFGLLTVCLPSFRRFETEVKRDVFAKDIK